MKKLAITKMTACVAVVGFASVIPFQLLAAVCKAKVTQTANCSFCTAVGNGSCEVGTLDPGNDECGSKETNDITNEECNDAASEPAPATCTYKTGTPVSEGSDCTCTQLSATSLTRQSTHIVWGTHNCYE